ncbi:hypothetical protein GALMADRAFT_258586 [Galerina marginata CBS 339.88]|uniref:Uncharacterized protein n=1 Tax=Galerina marginata (strain CBS 339.88) TaxID=685588 RepID=A0A067S8N8_GALM3|nr:hypothetical protein GALMADRAFT_258586 [Galerina marginata CBS 339.88]
MSSDQEKLQSTCGSTRSPPAQGSVGTLSLVLVRPAGRMPLKRAVIAFPASYEATVTTAKEVFELDGDGIHDGQIELRRSVLSIPDGTQEWARILPREWAQVVRPDIDELGVFLNKGHSGNNAVRNEEPVTLVHLISSKTRAEKARILVPLPESYEDCQQLAFNLMLANTAYNTYTPTSIVLQGKFPATQGAILATLTPASYLPYALTSDPVEIVVSW